MCIRIKVDRAMQRMMRISRICKFKVISPPGQGKNGRSFFFLFLVCELNEKRDIFMSNHAEIYISKSAFIVVSGFGSQYL